MRNSVKEPGPATARFYRIRVSRRLLFTARHQQPKIVSRVFFGIVKFFFSTCKHKRFLYVLYEPLRQIPNSRVPYYSVGIRPSEAKKSSYKINKTKKKPKHGEGGVAALGFGRVTVLMVL